MRIVLIISLVCLIGCATVGSKIDVNKLDQIKKGHTTKNEVIQLLGNPYFVNLTSDGKQILMYQYVKVKNKPANFVPVVGLLAGGMDMDQQILQILLDDNEVVEKFILSDSATEINSGLLNQ